jgi:hypothetical protein
MDLKETEVRDDCAGEDQQQFNRSTEASYFCGETDASLRGREPGSTEVERSTTLEAVTRRSPVETQ